MFLILNFAFIILFTSLVLPSHSSILRILQYYSNDVRPCVTWMNKLGSYRKLLKENINISLPTLLVKSKVMQFGEFAVLLFTNDF